MTEFSENIQEKLKCSPKLKEKQESLLCCRRGGAVHWGGAVHEEMVLSSRGRTVQREGAVHNRK